MKEISQIHGLDYSDTYTVIVDRLVVLYSNSVDGHTLIFTV